MTDLPTSGSADYNGYAQLVNENGAFDLPTEVVGVAALKVGFGAGGSMSGTLTDFDDAFSEYDGTLKVTGGSIGSGDNGPEISANVAGKLTRDSGGTFNVKGGITGGFLGDNGEYLNGYDAVKVTSGGKTADFGLSLNAAKE